MSIRTNFDTVSWETLPWSSYEDHVSRLQARIYSASFKQEYGKMRRLQEKLAHSPFSKLLAVQKITTNTKKRDRYIAHKIKNFGTHKIKNFEAQMDGLQYRIENTVKQYHVLTGAQKLSLALRLEFGTIENNKNTIIQDRAKQMLAKMVLEPEWEARFEANSYGYRPGRNAQDALEAVFLSLHHGKPKYILSSPRIFNSFSVDGDQIDKPNEFIKIQFDQDVFLKKVKTFPVLERQLRTWLKTELIQQRTNGTTTINHTEPSEEIDRINTIISGISKENLIRPLLINIALHGLEHDLQIWLKNQRKNLKLRTKSEQNITLIRYGDELLIIHPRLDVLELVQVYLNTWLSGLYKIEAVMPPIIENYVSPIIENYVSPIMENHVSPIIENYVSPIMENHVSPIIENYVSDLVKILGEPDKLNFQLDGIKIGRSTESFCFLGYNIIHVKKDGVFKTKITPSKQACKQFLAQCKEIIQRHHAGATHALLRDLIPFVINWGNYYRNCECKDTFSKMDYLLFEKLRAWVFRRHQQWGRKRIREKYFPTEKTWIFQERQYHDNWVLADRYQTPQGNFRDVHMIKLAWLPSRKHVKIQGIRSPYDGDIAYWTVRLTKYSALNTRLTRLLVFQNCICPECTRVFRPDDTFDVDHRLPLALGGKDNYTNLQVLHRHCHVLKTQRERRGP